MKFVCVHDTSVSFRGPSVAMMRNIISATSFGLKFCCFILNKWFSRSKDGLRAQ